MRPVGAHQTGDRPGDGRLQASSDPGPLPPHAVTPPVPVSIEESGHLRFKQGKAHFPLILTSGSALSPWPAGGGPPDGVERHRVLSHLVTKSRMFEASCSDPVQGSPFLWCQVDLGEERVALGLFLSDPRVWAHAGHPLWGTSSELWCPPTHPGGETARPPFPNAALPGGSLGARLQDKELGRGEGSQAGSAEIVLLTSPMGSGIPHCWHSSSCERNP